MSDSNLEFKSTRSFSIDQYQKGSCHGSSRPRSRGPRPSRAHTYKLKSRIKIFYINFNIPTQVWKNTCSK